MLSFFLTNFELISNRLHAVAVEQLAVVAAHVVRQHQVH